MNGQQQPLVIENNNAAINALLLCGIGIVAGYWLCQQSHWRLGQAEPRRQDDAGSGSFRTIHNRFNQLSAQLGKLKRTMETDDNGATRRRPYDERPMVRERGERGERGARAQTSEPVGMGAGD